ncbi:MAG TPA: GNAT family N-acetyltransferase, partial [Actinomycetes bacterium]|nr:GNAT family N-acetyltransferase [Actinomycetes bacterium]
MPSSSGGTSSGPVGAATIGQRVSVRLGAEGLGPSGGPAMRDVVGVLVDVRAAAAGSPEVWEIQRGNGTVERIRVDEIVVAKVVPGVAPAVRRANDISIADLEAVAADGWRPLESALLGGWRFRAAGGFTGRANSVLPLGDPAGALDDALELAVTWYAERGLPAKFQVPLPYA